MLQMVDLKHAALFHKKNLVTCSDFINLWAMYCGAFRSDTSIFIYICNLAIPAYTIAHAQLLDYKKLSMGDLKLL